MGDADAPPPPLEAPDAPAPAEETPSVPGASPRPAAGLSPEPPDTSSGSARPAGTLIALAPGVRVDRSAGLVEVDAVVCLQAGWLEQIACTPGTREHEAIFSVRARPRDIHAALLLLGLVPGRPGAWHVEGEQVVETPPSGPAVEILVRCVADGVERREPVTRWVREASSGKELPPTRWIFAGSLMARDREGDEFYVADVSGSVVGLVTFGDELLALPLVRADAEAVAPPEWEAWTERIPAPGTPVVLELRAEVDEDGKPRNEEAAPSVGERASPG